MSSTQAVRVLPQGLAAGGPLERVITEARHLSDGEPIPGSMGLRVGQGAELLPPALEVR